MKGPFIHSIRARAHWLLLAGAGSLTLALFSGCSGEKTETPVVLAKVGERVITADDFVAEVERRMAAMRPMSNRETVLAEMVEREAMLQKAIAAGLQDDPQIRRELDNLLIGKLRERELTPQLETVEVTDEDLKQAYQENISKYTRGARIRLAIIKIATRSSMSLDRQREAYEQLMDARENALKMDLPVKGNSSTVGFGNLALDYSEDQATRYRGGDLGWLDPSQLTYRCPPEVLTAGYALAMGELSEPIKTEDGYFLVLKSDSREAIVTPFDEAAPTLRSLSAAVKRRQVAETFTANALRQAGIEIDQQALAAVPLSPAARRLMVPRDELQPPALPGVNLSADAD